MARRGITRAERPNNLISVLVALAGEIAEKARQNANWSTDIPDAISVGTVEENNGTYKISISVDLDVAPQARAFEYGSGIHATKGTAGTYQIKPKTKSSLAFIWPGHTAEFPTGLKYIGPGQDGKLLFQYVDHPGVEPRPYMRPAIESVKPKIRKQVAKACKEYALDLLFRAEQ